MEAWTEFGWFNTRVRARWATGGMATGARTGGSGRWWTPSMRGSYANRDQKADVQAFQHDQRGEKARNLCSRSAKINGGD